MPHVNDLHEQHDPILVVSLASGDLATADRDRSTAQSLVDSCVDCARLHDDVLALAAATKALPPAVRTRDFRLTPEQAAQLQPGGWRRFFTAPGALFSRQLGVGLTTLGIAGILISSIGSLPLGSGGAAGGPAAGSAPSGAPAAAEALRTEDTLQAPQPAATFAGDTSAGGVDTTIAGSPAASSIPFSADRGASSAAASEAPPNVAASPAAAPTQDDASRNNASLAPMLPEGDDLGDASTPQLSATDDTSSGPPILLVVSSLLLVTGVVVLLAVRAASGARSS